jgi:hypothetical protein
VAERLREEFGVLLAGELPEILEAEPAPQLAVMAEERQQFRDAGG